MVKEETIHEEREVNGQTIIEAIEDLIHEGSVTRITIMDSDNKTLISFPVVMGIPAGLALAAASLPLLGFGLSAAFLTGCRLVIEREAEN
jgi:hypothetical protein